MEYSLSEPTLQISLPKTSTPFFSPTLLTLGDTTLNLLLQDFSTKCNSALAKYCMICKRSISNNLCYNPSIEKRWLGTLGRFVSFKVCITSAFVIYLLHQPSCYCTRFRTDGSSFVNFWKEKAVYPLLLCTVTE